MKKLTSKNEAELENLHVKVIDYPSSLILLFFLSGTFFISVSMIFPYIKLPMIIVCEVIILFVTSTNFSSKIVDYYARLIIGLKKEIK